MICVYESGDYLCDKAGDLLNRNVWVHKLSEGIDWGKRVFIHTVALDKGLKNPQVIIAQESEHAMAVHIYIDPKMHKRLSPRDGYAPVCWDGLVRALSVPVDVIRKGKGKGEERCKRVTVNAIWRERVMELVHVSDDAIHIVPTGTNKYEARVPVWFPDVLAEDGLVEKTWS